MDSGASDRHQQIDCLAHIENHRAFIGAFHRVHELTRITDHRQVGLWIELINVFFTADDAIELGVEHHPATKEPRVFMLACRRFMAEMDALRIPLAAHDRFARTVQNSNGQFGGLSLGHARLCHDLLPDQHHLAHRFQVHGQRPIKQVPILDTGQQHIPQRALMTEQQTDDSDIRHAPGFCHAQAKGRAR
ncbi:hypothetical protein D9M71_155400 [compost metagenome]